MSIVTDRNPNWSSENQFKSTTNKIQNEQTKPKRIETTYACRKFSIARTLQGMVQTIKKTKTLDEILISKQPLVSYLPNVTKPEAEEGGEE